MVVCAMILSCMYLFSAEGSLAPLPALRDAVRASWLAMAMSLRHESIGTCTSTIELVYDDSNSTCGQRFGHELTADGEESLRTLLALMHAERHCCARTAAFGVRCACLHHWSPWIALERTQQAALAMSTMLAVLRIIWLELAASMLLV